MRPAAGSAIIGFVERADTGRCVDEAEQQPREVARLESQIVEHLYDVWSIGQQIRDDERLGRAPRNTRACHQFGVCAYWGICATGIKPEEHPEAFVRVDNVHPEMEVVKQS